jgi:preprotein translocase subunit YajC
MPEFIAVAIVLVLALAAYWSLVILPRQQNFRKQQMFVRQMQPGDEVVTYGGLIGTIVDLDPDAGVARVRLADNVEVNVITAALTQPYNPVELASNARRAYEEEQASNK